MNILNKKVESKKVLSIRLPESLVESLQKVADQRKQANLEVKTIQDLVEIAIINLLKTMK